MVNEEDGIITKNIDSKAYSDEYIKEFKRKDIVVDSLEEALQLAEDYKKSGKYNWFRGQTGLWPLVSSANRLNDKDRNEAEEKLKRFDSWAFTKNLFTDFDSSEAIAQHHGLKTMFIDFTTDPKVAAYFASEEVNYKEYQYSCIYCLNTEDFNDSLKDIKKFFPNLPEYPRLLDIDVDNLWRLEVQKGKFLYQPCLNFDWFYSLHRIVFKVKENDIKTYDKSYIYPEIKSPLEEKIDGFILNEKTKTNLEHLYDFINQLKESGMYFEMFEADDELYIKEFISDEDKLLRYSWSEKEIKLWKEITIEKYQDTNTTENILLKIDSFKNIDENKVKIYNQILNMLNAKKDIRKKAISFIIEDNEKNIKLIEKFEKHANLIWNGMRRLPYENDDIAKVISDLVQILDLSMYEYEQLNKNFLKIGFSDITGSGNIAFVNESFLYEAMRDDLQEFIVKKTKDVRTIIYHIRSPQLLYNFELLKRLFVESIIISQVLYGSKIDVCYDVDCNYKQNCDYSKKDFVIFSPTEVNVLGIP